MGKNKIILKISMDQLEDIRSAVSFTAIEYERVRKDRAPLFIRGLESARKKLWTKNVIAQSRRA